VRAVCRSQLSVERGENGENQREIRFSMPCKLPVGKKRSISWAAGVSSHRLPGEVVGAPSIPGGVEGRVGWGRGQPGLVLSVEVGGPVCGGGLELHDS